MMVIMSQNSFEDDVRRDLKRLKNSADYGSEKRSKAERMLHDLDDNDTDRLQRDANNYKQFATFNGDFDDAQKAAKLARDVRDFTDEEGRREQRRRDEELNRHQYIHDDEEYNDEY